jgi:uncharacterized repeat protein (TIGR01451 family)
MIRLLTFIALLAVAALPARAALSCGAAAETLDWDSGSVGWTAGALSGSYAVGGETIGVAFTGATNRLINIFGQQTPFKSVDLTGGLSPTQQSLLFVVNYVNTSETLTMTINAGTAGQGVAEIEFTIFDLDTNGPTAPFSFQDQITVTGTLGGISAGAPTFTTGAANTASGNVATGTNDSANTAGAGNLTIKFASPVDQITIAYRAGPQSIADPAQQGMSLHDIRFCRANVDYGDAPASYGAPSHRIAAGVMLGSGAPDAEVAPQYSAGADGDDNAGADDENGVVIPTLARSQPALISAAASGAGGFLQAWIDWNGDGDFLDAGEQVATNLQDNAGLDVNPGSGVIAFQVTPPASATTSQTYARFRWSTTGGLTHTGTAASGEVEDYALTIQASAPPASCPAGQLLLSQTGNAASAVSASGVVNPALALGALAALGTSPPGPVAAELDNSSDIFVLDLGGLVPQFSTLILSAARDSGGAGNTGRVTIQLSPDNVSYTTMGTYGAPGATYPSLVQNALERANITVPAGGARYVRLTTVDNDDVFIDGLEYSEVCIASATLTATKTVTVYDPSAAGLFAVPGNDVVYSITVTNAGSGGADSNSIFIVDRLPAEIEFFNGDMDGAGPATGAVYFTQSGAGLTFTLATDLRYATGASPPASFAACTYAAAAGYDPNIRFVCFNPKGAMAAGDPDPSFTVQFRARIK